jgi:predicted MFS family arabinose efflux permease
MKDMAGRQGGSASPMRTPAGISRLKSTLFLAAAGLLWFSLFPYVAILTPYVESLGASHAQAGIIVGSFGFIQIFLRVPSGLLSDSLNRRRIFIQASFAFSFLSALGFLSSGNLTFILISRTLAGVAATNWVHFNVLYTSYFSADESSKAVGALNSVAMTAQTMALYAGGFLADRASIRVVFALAGAVALSGFALSFFLEENRDEAVGKMAASAWPSVFRNGRLITIAGFAILIQILTYAVTFGFIPMYAKSRFGATGSSLASLSVAATVAGALSSLAGNTRMVRRLHEMPLAAAGLLICAAASAATPLALSMTALGVLQTVSGLGRGLAFTMAMALAIGSVPRDRRATAMGFYQATYGIGMVIGPVLMGILADSYGLAFGFALIGSAAAILALVLTFAYTRLSRS